MSKKNKEKQYSEAELITLFGLTRWVGNDKHPLLAEWLKANTQLSDAEQTIFDAIHADALENIEAWQEEDLKMQLIAFVLHLGHLKNNHRYRTYFEKTIAATVENTFLKTKTDFMIAKGVLNLPQIPYFHFQEYKPQHNPTGEVMAQLLTAFLIAQTKNQANHALYGCEVVGAYWKFVILQDKTYCISSTYDATDKQDLLKIIAILRQFKAILETLL
jgi:hypothetical protein